MSINEHEAPKMLPQSEIQILKETPVTPDQMTGEEVLAHSGVYTFAFNVTYPVISKDPQTKGAVRGRKTSWGILMPHFGSFKITAMKLAGKWVTVDYGPELDEAYGSDKKISGLYVRLTPDFGENLASIVWELSREVDAEHGPYSHFQVHLKVKLPNERGAIIRQEYRDGVQYAHRVILAGEPVVLGPDKRDEWVPITEDGIEYNTETYFGNLATKDFSKLSITPANVGQMAVSARKKDRAQAPTRRAATTAAGEVMDVKSTPTGQQAQLKPILPPVDRNELDRG